MTDSSHPPPHPWEADFSVRVVAARAAAGWSEEELARRVREYGLPFNGVDVTRIESGAHPIGLNEALVVRTVLGIELPEVTKTAQVRLINGAYAQAVATLQRQWSVIVGDLARSRRSVVRALDHAVSMPTAYTSAVRLAGGRAEPELVTAMKELIKEMSAVRRVLGDLDAELGGALSTPSAEAALPGSQRQ